MTDPKDELGARFDERRPGGTDDSDDLDNSNNTGNPSGSGDASNPDNSGDSSDAGDRSSKPGPNPDADATRNRRQVPMYLPDEKADLLNGLYERLDGRSKVAGDGGIEKHKDFMEEVVDFAVEHEDELAERLDIDP